jgi:hypothetical protein
MKAKEGIDHMTTIQNQKKKSYQKRLYSSAICLICSRIEPQPPPAMLSL